jgi:amino acid transporter
MTRFYLFHIIGSLHSLCILALIITAIAALGFAFMSFFQYHRTTVGGALCPDEESKKLFLEDSEITKKWTKKALVVFAVLMAIYAFTTSEKDAVCIWTAGNAYESVKDSGRDMGQVNVYLYTVGQYLDGHEPYDYCAIEPDEQTE